MSNEWRVNGIILNETHLKAGNVTSVNFNYLFFIGVAEEITMKEKCTAPILRALRRKLAEQ